MKASIPLVDIIDGIMTANQAYLDIKKPASPVKWGKKVLTLV